MNQSLLLVSTIVIFTALFLAISDCSALMMTKLTIQNKCTQYKGICQADWMSNLPPSVQDRNIKRLLVLGSHDTGAQAPLNFEATPPCEHTKFFNIANDLAKSKLTAPLIVPILNNLTITQPLSVFEQLEQGTRAFDLRITWSNITNKLYLSHSFVAQPLEDSLAMMQQFLVAHPGEILFIEAEYDYEHQTQTAPHVDEILALFYKYLGVYLNPQCNHISALANMTLKNVVASNKRVILGFSESFNEAANPSICNGGRIFQNYWPNGQNSTMSINRIKNYLATHNLSNDELTVNLIFFTVTDDTASIIEDVLQDIFKTHHFIGLKEWSANIRPLAWQVLQNYVEVQKRSGLSIISVDWATDEYVQKVINWNLVYQSE